MAPQPIMPPTGGQVDEYAEILEHLLQELDVSFRERREARNRHEVNPSHSIEVSPHQPRPDRAQTIQCIRKAISDLSPQEVAIIYDNGLSFEKLDKEHLCNISRYFSNALKGPFREASTRIIRLRHDFPWAVYAMLDYIKNDRYYMYPLLQVQFPHITMLDLHIHCYIMADKYNIPKLGDYAGISYLRVAADVLALHWDVDDPRCYDDSLNLPCVEYHPHDMCAAAEVSRFLDSVVLLWVNTATRHNALRKEVVEMIKACFVKLIRLKSFQYLLYNLQDFLYEIMYSSRKDGLDMALMVRKEKGYGVIFES